MGSLFMIGSPRGTGPGQEAGPGPRKEGVRSGRVPAGPAPHHPPQPQGGAGAGKGGGPGPGKRGGGGGPGRGGPAPPPPSTPEGGGPQSPRGGRGPVQKFC